MQMLSKKQEQKSHTYCCAHNKRYCEESYNKWSNEWAYNPSPSDIN